MSPVGKVEFTDQAVVVIRVLVSMAKGKKSINCYAAVRGIYCAIRSFPPPPSFEIIFFPRRISLRRAVYEVYNPKRCIFKAFSSLFLSLFYFFPLTL